MTEIGKGTVPITFNRSQIEADARAAIIPALNRVAGDAALLVAGKKLFDFGKSGLDALEQAQRITAQTEAQLRATGGAAGVTAKDIDELAGSMRDLAGFDDEAARSAANVLLRFGAIHGEGTFARAEKDAGDLAIAMGTDLPAAAETLGKALQNPDKAMRLLRPVIGQLSDAQKESIKRFEDQGDMAAAQGVIFDLLEAKIGGSAKAFGETLAGQVAKGQASLKEAKEELVAGFAPAVTLGASLVKGFADGINALPGPLREVAGVTLLLGGGILAFARPVNDVINLLGRFGKASEDVAAASTAVSTAETAQVAVNEALTASNTELAASEVAVQTASLGVGGVLTLAVAGVGVAAGVFSALSDALGTTSRATDDYTAAIEKNTGTLQQNVDAVTGNQLEHNAAALAANNAGISYATMFAAVRSGTDDFGEYGRILQHVNNNMTPVGTQAHDLADELRHAGADSTDFGRRLIGLVEAGTLTGNQLFNLVKALEGLHNGYGLGSAAAARHKTVTDAVTGATDENTTSTLSNADAQKQLASALQTQESGRQKMLDSTRNLYDAEQSFAAAQKGVETAQRGVVDAERGVEAANRRVADSLRSVEDAQRRVIDAQKALDEALKPADSETLGKAQLGVESAHLRVADAAQAVADAQAKVTQYQRDGKHTADDVAGAQRDVEKAQISYKEALYGVTDADKSLQDVQAKGTEQDQAVVSARQAVTDATQAVDSANQSLADAYGAVADAQRRVSDAQDAVAGAYAAEGGAAAKLKDAQDNLYGGVSTVNTALLDQITALQNVDALLKPGSTERKNLDDYIQHLFVLAGIFQTTDFVGPGLDTAPPGYVAPGRSGPGPGLPLVGTRAGGGWVGPGQRFEGAEQGWELGIMPKHGIYQAPPQGMFVLPHMQSELAFAGAGGHRGLHLNGDINVYNPAPEPASSSIGTELQIMADQLALVG